MRIITTKNYQKIVAKLGVAERKLIHTQLDFLSKDIFHSRLHTKKLKGFEPDFVYSFRITRTYRGIFRLQGNEVILFAIGHRKDVYRNY